MKNCPIVYKIYQVGNNFCPILNKPSKIAKDILVYAEVAKFRQIWSHWYLDEVKSCLQVQIGTYVLPSSCSWSVWLD